MSIETDTPLIPLIIAESICATHASWLASKAERVYALNPKFRAKLKRGGDKPREVLAERMRHWLAVELTRTGTPHP